MLMSNESIHSQISQCVRHFEELNDVRPNRIVMSKDVYNALKAEVKPFLIPDESCDKDRVDGINVTVDPTAPIGYVMVTREEEEEEAMDMNEYQKLANRTSRKDISPDEHLLNAMLGLAGEAGECCDLVKKSRFQDGRRIEEMLIDEAGDVLWYVAELASALGVTLNGIAQHNIRKLQERYPEGFDPERSLHREG